MPLFKSQHPRPSLALFTFHAVLNKVFHPSSTRACSMGVAALRGELTTPTKFGLKLRGVFTHCTSSPFGTKWKSVAIFCNGNGWSRKNNRERTKNKAQFYFHRTLTALLSLSIARPPCRDAECGTSANPHC
jgi:hypothetical protein